MEPMRMRLTPILIVVALAAACGGSKVPADATKTPSGLAYKVVTPGSGTEHPGPTSIITVHYTGWTLDGNKFDSSVDKGRPLVYPLNNLIPGWVEGIQLMVKGEKMRFWIPGNLAYDNSTREGTPKGMLIFDVELLDFK
jgi:FKBP-type peptidyl-prolyl cis-trans isomerase